MHNTKFFICPMSKNIVDSIVELNSPLIGLLPSRRQIDYNGGYVNKWNTLEFVNYVRDKSNIIIERDHAGINQNDSDYIKSYEMDSKLMNIIHIDPWKNQESFSGGLIETIKNIRFIHNINPYVKFEIGTEESIRKFTTYELLFFVRQLKIELSDSEFRAIEYICIQSGVGIDLVNRINIGTFNQSRLDSMIQICKKFDKKSKEHNGDYLSDVEIKTRFESGLDSINIGPEIVQIETDTYLEHMTENQIDEFYDICLNSKKWEKWVSSDFQFEDKRKLISVCGHYCYCEYNLPDVHEIIKQNLKNKFTNLLNYVK